LTEEAGGPGAGFQQEGHKVETGSRWKLPKASPSYKLVELAFS
jgi:hypothetical protein